jgi:hypothetical protein
MVWIRGLIFTILVPCVVAIYVPSRIYGSSGINSGWSAGWLLVAAGAIVYALYLFEFLASGGTPAIFFTRKLKFVLGEEPTKLLQDGLHWRSFPKFL